MKIEINRTSNNPSNTLLDVYAHNTRPLCRIYEEDFERILSDRQLKRLEDGKTLFNVQEKDLFTLCQTWFGNK